MDSAHTGPGSANASKEELKTVPSSGLTESTMNPNVVKAAYAVRGELVIKAEAYKQQILAGHTLPFDTIVPCNIGNPHELGQQPLTFFRQVLSLCMYPALLSEPSTVSIYPRDAIERARSYLSQMKTTGAYTNSKGLGMVRSEVADFIRERDGFATDPERIFLTDGASPAVKLMLSMLVRDGNDGILTPIPQYPLYSGTLSVLGGTLVEYYLNEDKGWTLDTKELERAHAAAVAKGITVRAIVIINPGNPTGQCLTEENVRDVVRFCLRHKLVLLADEVYQTNIYSTTPFISFRKVAKGLGVEAASLQLASFHSVSKGFLGECGLRGGYLHLTGFGEDVVAQAYKLASISLCSNVVGQLTVGLMTNPPRKGAPSYDLYVKERDSTLESLKRRALKVAKALNAMEGVSCQPVEGALYAFPRISLPPSAHAAAKAAGKTPDTFYALALLDATGICVVPGSGFGQAPGTLHYRTTILPAEADMDRVIRAMEDFHKAFMVKHRGGEATDAKA